MKLSANLGFLWKELPLIERVRAAKTAGFDAVECHWPYDTPALDLKAVLEETGLPMVSINTSPGDKERGEFGLSALPNRKLEARAAIDQAIEYATAIQAPNIHVMSGLAEGQEAYACFIENLSYACERAQTEQINILIEPLNHFDVPNYFLKTTHQGIQIVKELGASNLKLLFDCYHAARMGESVLDQMTSLKSMIGHVQIASAPDRREPNHGDLPLKAIVQTLNTMEYHGTIGAEYYPEQKVEDDLAWMEEFR